MPGRIEGACEQLAARLKTPQRAADIDPEVLNPPCVWISPREVLDPTLDGGGTLVAWCYLIASSTETPAAMRQLDELLAAVLEVADLAESDRTIDLAAAIVLPTNPNTPLPAYRVAVDLDL